jgi:hypothetical protein
MCFFRPKKISPSLITYNQIIYKIGNYQALNEFELGYVKKLNGYQKYHLIRLLNICLFNVSDFLNKD